MDLAHSSDEEHTPVGVVIAVGTRALPLFHRGKGQGPHWSHLVVRFSEPCVEILGFSAAHLGEGSHHHVRGVSPSGFRWTGHCAKRLSSSLKGKTTVIRARFEDVREDKESRSHDGTSNSAKNANRPPC